MLKSGENLWISREKGTSSNAKIVLSRASISTACGAAEAAVCPLLHSGGPGGVAQVVRALHS